MPRDAPTIRKVLDLKDTGLNFLGGGGGTTICEPSGVTGVVKVDFADTGNGAWRSLNLVVIFSNDGEVRLYGADLFDAEVVVRDKGTLPGTSSSSKTNRFFDDDAPWI